MADYKKAERWRGQHPKQPKTKKQRQQSAVEKKLRAAVDKAVSKHKTDKKGESDKKD